MWDLIVLIPDHCLSFYFPRTAFPTNSLGPDQTPHFGASVNWVCTDYIIPPTPASKKGYVSAYTFFFSPLWIFETCNKSLRPQLVANPCDSAFSWKAIA